MNTSAYVSKIGRNVIETKQFKMFAHADEANPNYRITCNCERDTLLCAQSFRPISRATINVDLFGVGQQDGRAWGSKAVDAWNDDMTERIMSALRSMVGTFVKKIDPMSCWR